MESTYTLIFAVLGGLLPALFWLWFWLHEDGKSPEPRGLVARAFLAGMGVVILVLPFQGIAFSFFKQNTFVMIILWAATEEIFKFGAAYFTIFHRKELDEPIDAVIYLITAALGFVALENAMFLFFPSMGGNVTDSIITGNLRFVGASLLHVIASASIGIAIAFSFYRTQKVRRFYTIFGLFIAVALHTAFNLFIMDENGENTLVVFSVLWLAIAGLMLFFEKIKSLAH